MAALNSHIFLFITDFQKCKPVGETQKKVEEGRNPASHFVIQLGSNPRYGNLLEASIKMS